MFLVFSTSLHPDSRSRILAQAAAHKLNEEQASCELVELQDMELPFCDGNQCYNQPAVRDLAEKIGQASGILIAAPVYNYSLAASAKNLIELTGNAWNDKVVGFLCAAGGQGSYMAPMGLANSLMLDFRCLILPQFVYANDSHFRGDQISDSEVNNRMDELVKRLIAVTSAVLR